MNSNTKKAKEMLNKGDYTLVLCNGNVGEAVFSAERGVSPLLNLIDSGKDLSAYSAADKVVGRAAAFLYVLMKIEEVCALTLSEGAKEVFDKHGVTYCYDELVPYIINRQGDGICPMEKATKDAADPDDALKRVREKLRLMM